MIIMGAGTNQWFHSDTIYRAILALTMLTGCQGVNGGGWAHYVGQEKCRPITGWASSRSALDWVRPPRQMIGTAFWYLHTDQWRYDGYRRRRARVAAGRGLFRACTRPTCSRSRPRLGWMPSYPHVRPQPARPGRRGGGRGQGPGGARRRRAARRAAAVRLRGPGRAGELPAGAHRVAGEPARLVGQGQRVLPQAPARHRLRRCAPSETPADKRPRDVIWRDEAPEGKLDLLLSLDFRMTSTTLFSDIVLPAATWYEKHDLSTTDMHPFVHAFNPAIDPPWETRTDFDAFHAIAAGVQRAGRRSTSAPAGTSSRCRCCTTPRTRPRNPAGRCWTGSRRVRAGPGQDDAEAHRGRARLRGGGGQAGALGPLVDRLGMTTKARHHHVRRGGRRTSRHVNGTVRGGVGRRAAGAGQGRSKHARRSSRCRARRTGGWPSRASSVLEKRTGQRLVDLAAEHEGKRITFADTQAARCR